MTLVRKLQIVYRMEPAGSQGVWALDDYQFLPFIWGAAQLIDEQKLEPKSISDYDKAATLAPDNHFFRYHQRLVINYRKCSDAKLTNGEVGRQ